MTIHLADLDAHEQPPDHLRAEWKHFSRLDASALTHHDAISHPQSCPSFIPSGSISRAQASDAYSILSPSLSHLATSDIPILFHPLLPDLFIIPNLVPPPVQSVLLDRLLHQHLSQPAHQTNLHLHYRIPYPPSGASFFSLPPSEPFLPLDPAVHKTLSAQQVLNRRLHWLTLGGQYDWTRRIYPDEQQPQFPPDIARFLAALFPDTVPQAAIVNLYSPGDTMMMHRDVSEHSSRGLVSLSLGCDGLFMIAPSSPPCTCPNNGHALDSSHHGSNCQAAREKLKDPDYLVLKLGSGDAIYMTGQSRYAWHGVPKVLKDTCPPELADWPACHGQYADWKGWLRNKRVNLNVRQMQD
ncbi:hypothetical protein CDD81_7263 [Ophiocordyceps australis]|uniref:mRNA N(6)-methyladenine demethylase n=1 Tax=Ophiocordyceps australis TaxID=1399860 RepID=A0A2C5XYD4_9HYPO|nr:hypothetical protein CDD81_7263 [Ophiocordyceps australis]